MKKKLPLRTKPVPGGFEEKIAAAHEAGAELVIIARSENEHGSGYAEIAAEIKHRYQTAE